MTAKMDSDWKERLTIELTHIARVWLGTDLLNQLILGVTIESRWLSSRQRWGGSSCLSCPISYCPAVFADSSLLFSFSGLPH
jgi:hypothetical protein